jgi:hypothetical protein
MFISLRAATTARSISASPTICEHGLNSIALVAAQKFVSKYKIHRLVYVESCASPREAIVREKQLKNWRRDWKIRLIEQDNVDWNDLSGLI